MTKKNESGKARVIKGSMLYLWEELKTLNVGKFRALSRIVSGYFRMKFKDAKKARDRSNDFSINGR